MKSNKGMATSTLGKILIAVALFVVLLSALYGKGIIPELGDKIVGFFRNVPEIDPTKNEVNFFINNKAQIEFFTAFNKVIKTSASCDTIRGACIATLPNFDEGFYYDGGNYNLKLEQEGENINLRLTRWARQDVDPNSAKTETPVALPTVIENAHLCIIKGADASIFYEEFNKIDARDIPDASGINPTIISSMIVSSGIDEQNNRERRIGFKYTPDTKDYEYQLLYKKKDKSLIYIMRITQNDKNYVCFLPAYNDLMSGCSKPNGDGYMDADCFDGDDSKNTLKTNIGKGLIPAEFLCGDALISDNNCLCGGTFVNSKCSNDFSQVQCDCANWIVKSYSKNMLQRLIEDFIYDSASSKCVYNPSEGCKYLQLAEPSFLVNARDVNNWNCPLQS
jgi:hypothetical protein